MPPTKGELEAAAGGTVADVIGPGLGVLFCGINPSLYSAAVGGHFARPGNRFWPALYRAAFTDRLIAASEQDQLLGFGCGITNLVERATATAAELTSEELVAGRRRLERRVRRHAPRFVAVLGIGAYRTAFGRRQAPLGGQEACLAGSRLWVLPNPSGLNAHYQLDDLTRLFAELRHAVATSESSAGRSSRR